jgi:hypothetical protein
MALTVGGRELYVFLINDADIYRQRLQPIRANLTRKKASGKYSKSLAPKGFMYAVDDAAKKYARETGTSQPWHKMFPKDDRESVARQLTEDFEVEYKAGSYDEYIPKKYRKK